MAQKTEIPVGGEEIGAEFITWLWHADRSGEVFTVDKSPVRIGVGELLRVRALDGTGADVTLKGEHASGCPELFTALHRGALIVSARVQVDLNGTVITASLKAPTLSLTGCKLPKDVQRETGPVTEEGEKPGAEVEQDRERLADEARLIGRMAWLDQAQDAVDACLSQWLAARTDGTHATWLKQFRKWVAENVSEHARASRSGG